MSCLTIASWLCLCQARRLVSESTVNRERVFCEKAFALLRRKSSLYALRTTEKEEKVKSATDMPTRVKLSVAESVKKTQQYLTR